jgi:hypothetical protein
MSETGSPSPEEMGVNPQQRKEPYFNEAGEYIDTNNQPTQIQKHKKVASQWAGYLLTRLRQFRLGSNWLGKAPADGRAKANLLDLKKKIDQAEPVTFNPETRQFDPINQDKGSNP